MITLVLGAERYDFVDEKTGERRSGGKLHVVQEPVQQENKVGAQAETFKLNSVELFGAFLEPGLYDLDVRFLKKSVGYQPTVFAGRIIRPLAIANLFKVDK